MHDVADVLERAAEVIEENGWCQNEIQTEDGRVCLYGAIMVATDGSVFTISSPAFDAAHDAMIAHLARPIGLGPWNDTPGRTKHEVIDALRHCAKDLRNAARV